MEVKLEAINEKVASRGMDSMDSQKENILKEDVNKILKKQEIH